ncbi:MAG TPA: hypothetical protein GX530_05375 [Corynebacteriales bacterium]|nr:hypothetical protein [Mycobacteriales bacterium]
MSRRALDSVNSAVPWVALWSAALTTILLWPSFKPGYVLTRDAVSTPRSYITPSTMGLGDQAARAVPQDAFIAILSQVVDGGVLVKALTFIALFMAGLGAAVIGWYFLYPGTRGQALAQGLPAVTFGIWNPYVIERLLQGHWSLLLGYAALPWIAVAGVLTFAPSRTTRRTAWGALAASIAAAAITPSGAIMGTVMALVAGLFPKRPIDRLEVRTAQDHTASPLSNVQRIFIILGLGLLVSLPWIYPSLRHVGQGGIAISDAAGVAAFAARGEGPQGVLGILFSLISMGGIWNVDAVPPSRMTLFVFPFTVIFIAILGLGLWRFRHNRARKTIYIWLGFSALLVLILSLLAYPTGLKIVTWMVNNIPGVGLFRDTQKWVAFLFPLYAILVSAAGRTIIEKIIRSEYSSKRWLNPTAIAILCGLLILLVPDAPVATYRNLQPVQYSSSWEDVAQVTKDSNGDMMVLPSGQLRVFESAPNRTVLDPAPRFMPVEVLKSGDLVVSTSRTSTDPDERDVTVQGEGNRADQVENALLTGAPAGVLASLGVRWVLVENTIAPEVPDTLPLRNALRGLEPVITSPDLTLYQVPGIVSREYAPTRWEWTWAITMHIVWLLVMVVGYSVTIAGTIIERKRSAEASQW